MRIFFWCKNIEFSNVLTKIMWKYFCNFDIPLIRTKLMESFNKLVDFMISAERQVFNNKFWYTIYNQDCIAEKTRCNFGLFSFIRQEKSN